MTFFGQLKIVSGWLVLVIASGVSVIGCHTARLTHTPADASPTRIRVSEPFANLFVRRALENADELLATTNCQSLVHTFTRIQGGTLDDSLVRLNVGLSAYLRLLIFEDGSPPVCNGETLWYTSPNSRVVFVCARTVERLAINDPRLLALTMIHEIFHTLGLGERALSSAGITAAIRQRCGE